MKTKKCKHDWQQTGTVEIPTGKFLYELHHMGGAISSVSPVTFEALVHICRDCEKVKTTKILELKQKSK